MIIDGDNITAIVIAVIGVAGTAIGGMFAWLNTVSKRTDEMKQKLEALERRDRLSWLYIRSLIDHAYRHNATPIPQPPEGWDDLT